MITQILRILSKGIIFILFICFLFRGSTDGIAEKLFKDTADHSQAIREAKDRLKEDLSKGDSSKIEKLIRENPNDAEIHQGIAELLDLLGYAYADTEISEYRKAISIAPEEEHLRIGLILINTSLLNFYDEIDRYNYNFEYDKKDRENRINTLIKECDEAEKLWPQNAFYNYAKAYVYLMQDEKEKAEVEIQKALDKPYMHQYRDTVLTSRDRILTLLVFPLREKIAINQTFTASYAIPMGKCAKYLIAKGEELQEKREFKEAIKLYNDAVTIYKQRAESDLLGGMEQYPLHKTYSKIYECYKEQGLQEKVEAIGTEKEIDRIEEGKNKYTQRVEEFYNFISTADEKELEEEYKLILQRGYIMK